MMEIERNLSEQQQQQLEVAMFARKKVCECTSMHQVEWDGFCDLKWMCCDWLVAMFCIRLMMQFDCKTCLAILAVTWGILSSLAQLVGFLPMLILFMRLFRQLPRPCALQAVSRSDP